MAAYPEMECLGMVGGISSSELSMGNLPRPQSSDVPSPHSVACGGWGGGSHRGSYPGEYMGAPGYGVQPGGYIDGAATCGRR